jgi:hypothetical protein
MGFMSRHHDKLIAALTAPEPKPRRTAPRSHQEVQSFVKGFGLSAAATRQLVEQWNEDICLARTQGYDEGYDEGRDW